MFGFVAYSQTITVWAEIEFHQLLSKVTCLSRLWFLKQRTGKAFIRLVELIQTEFPCILNLYIWLQLGVVVQYHDSHTLFKVDNGERYHAQWSHRYSLNDILSVSSHTFSLFFQ